MSSSNSDSTVESVETVFQQSIESSSDDPPMDQWSSLVISAAPSDNLKMVLAKEGKYDPGSGEICAKYIAMSDSDVARHVYYQYPAVMDPGIMTALLKPMVQKIYSSNGQELYLDLCGAMNVAPVRVFHRGLLNEEIDLKYYGVNPIGVRAMCLALVNNKHVRRLDLTSNHLSRDACYHLGQLLGDSFALQELVVSGCKLGPEGIRLLTDQISKKTMELLDLSKNELGDVGFQYLAKLFARGAVIKRLNLSYNNLTDQSGLAFAEALECNNTITHLDISWNKIFGPKGANKLLLALAESKTIVELNLSWNALTATTPLKQIVSMKQLQVLDLSSNSKLQAGFTLTPSKDMIRKNMNVKPMYDEKKRNINLTLNRLTKDAIKMLCSKLHLAKKLDTLDISHNQLKPLDAFTMLTKMKDKRVKLKKLLMRDVLVTREFLELLKEVKELSYRADTTIIYGDVIHDYAVSMPDLREIVMKRIGYINRPHKKKKKKKVHVALIFLELHKEKQFIDPTELLRAIKNANAPPLSEDLITELVNCFPGPKTDTGRRTLNLDGVVEFIHRMWPNIKLLPPPPPPPPPVVVKKSLKSDKKKGKRVKRIN